VSNTLLCAFHQISSWGKCKEVATAGTRHKKGRDEKFSQLYPESLKGQAAWKIYKFTAMFFYRCTVHSDIHTVHSPTDSHLLKR